MPYCHNCGAETEAEAAHCGSCGARLEGETPPAAPRPPARRGSPWVLLGAIVVLVAVVAGGVVLFGALTGDGDDEERLPNSEDAEIVEAVSSPTVPTEATAEVEPSPIPAEPTPSEPTPVPPPPGYASPEEAIAAYLQDIGLEYIGDCANANIDTDIGAYCSLLWEDRGDELIYTAGLTFSEPDTWLLVGFQGETGGWLVVDDAVFVPGPQDTVPPWP